MNTGQLLVSLSGLPSGSALAHLMAITAGTGTGETIFASMFSVSIEQPTVSVTRRAKRAVEQAPAKPPVVAQRQSKGALHVSVFTAPDRTTVITGLDEMSIFTGTNSATLNTQLESATIRRKG